MDYLNQIDSLRDNMLSRLRSELNPQYTYHSIEHTEDVMHSAARISYAHGLHATEHHLVLLAAAYHDAGFLISDVEHEEIGCRMLTEDAHGILEPDDVQKVCGMIKATRVPQQPMNLLEQIVCDADLDYLGRIDFATISKLLFDEFRVRGVVEDEEAWMKLQISFFESHKYWTDYSKNLRGPSKARHLISLKEQLVSLLAN